MLVVGCLLLPGCETEKKKAFELNQQFAAITDSLQEKGTQMAKVLGFAISARDFSYLHKPCTTIPQFTRQKIVALKNMEDAGGSERLRLAMLELLDYEERLTAEICSLFNNMGNTTPDEELEAAMVKVKAKMDEENKYLLKIQEAQREFASRNGFTLTQ
jgi:hypothetical protein